MSQDVQQTIDQLAREAYSKIVAYLSASFRDLAEIQDALSEAFITALRRWPDEGVPDHPEAWLLTVARRKLLDRAKQMKTRSQLLESITYFDTQTKTLDASLQNDSFFPDKRLELLFVCSHPAIEEHIHTPLMLQTVLGMTAETIASLYLVPPPTMGQRLSRAKRKIRQAGIRIEYPKEENIKERIHAVLEAIYAMYGLGWEDITSYGDQQHGFATEALFLTRLLNQQIPNHPETMGLLALILFCESRRAARRGKNNEFIPLSKQNPDLWDANMIEEAESVLRNALTYSQLSRFQLEASIQSVHSSRLWFDRVDKQALMALYQKLLQTAPTIGAILSYAVVLEEHAGAETALEQLNEIPEEATKNHQTYWVVKSHLLEKLNRVQESKNCLNRAIGLTEDQSTRDFLLNKLAR